MNTDSEDVISESKQMIKIGSLYVCPGQVPYGFAGYCVHLENNVWFLNKKEHTQGDQLVIKTFKVTEPILVLDEAGIDSIRISAELWTVLKNRSPTYLNSNWVFVLSNEDITCLPSLWFKQPMATFGVQYQELKQDI